MEITKSLLKKGKFELKLPIFFVRYIYFHIFSRFLPSPTLRTFRAEPVKKIILYHQTKNPTTSELTSLTLTFEDRSCILLVLVFQQIFSAKYHFYLHLVNFQSRVLFIEYVFGQESESENCLYLYSAKYMNPNIICIPIWPKIWIQILFRYYSE